MSDLLEDVYQTRLRLGANEFLLQAVLIRLMLVDPGFAKDAREWFDTVLGHLSASDKANAISPQNFSTIRETYLHLLAQAEESIITTSASPMPKSIRRRIFEWFERG